MSEPFFAAMQDAAKKAQKRTVTSTPDGQPSAKRPGVITEAVPSDDSTNQGQLAAPTVPVVSQGQPETVPSASTGGQAARQASGGSVAANLNTTGGIEPGALFFDLTGSNVLHGAIFFRDSWLHPLCPQFFQGQSTAVPFT